MAKSIRCTDTGKLFRNLQDAQLYAERTGNSNFEECDQEVAPLSEEEKQAKIEQIRIKLAEKRKEREEEDKVRGIEEEKNRRLEGQKMLEARDEYEQQQRKRDYEDRKKEKEAFLREKERLRLEVAKDKAERAGDAARRRGESPEGVKEAYQVALDKALGKGMASEAEKTPLQIMNESIKTLSAYKVVDEGLVALKTINKMLSNIATNPQEEKFLQVNLENEAFKKRVASKVGGVAFLKACGFEKHDRKLHLSKETLDIDLIKQGVKLLDEAISAYF